MFQILERIIANHLQEVMMKRLNPFQHGYRKEHSQLSNLVCIHEHILLRVSTFGRVDCVRLDFTRAAETVSHAIIVEKLRQLCIDPLVVNWISAFLQNRVQSVKVGNALSNPRKVTCGLPQGSPLSNILLTIYLNDLRAKLSNENIYQYSDDTLITKVITDEEDCVDLQQQLKSLEMWMVENGMEINMKKCQFISFSLKGRKRKYAKMFGYKLGGVEIERVPSFKFLGIFISDDFSWSKHIDYLIFEKIDVDLQRNKKYDKKTYVKYLRPKLEKCSAVWNPQLRPENLEMITKLEKVQDTALSKFSSRDLPSLAERRVIQLLMLICKVVAKHKPYAKIAKSIDICDVDFSLPVFNLYMSLKDSIFGAAIKELVLLNNFIDNTPDCSISIQSVVKQCNPNLSILNDFSKFRYKNFIECVEEEEIETKNALVLLSSCFHPKFKPDQLLNKINEICAKATDEIPRIYVHHCYLIPNCCLISNNQEQ